MDMIKSLLGDNFKQLTDHLQTKGFNSDQANAFIPEAAKKFMDVFQNNKDAVNFANLESTAHIFLEKIDLNALSAKIGISEDLAHQGIQNILPSLLQLAETHKDKLEMFSGLASSNLGNMLGSFAGKLFGK